MRPLYPLPRSALQQFLDRVRDLMLKCRRITQEHSARTVGHTDPHSAVDTVHVDLERHGLVEHSRDGRRHKPHGTSLPQVTAPTRYGEAACKGEYKLGNGRYGHALTVTDQASCFLLLCNALESTKEASALDTVRHLFGKCGFPATIRDDNGLGDLSKLSVWWLRLASASCGTAAPAERAPRAHSPAKNSRVIVGRR